MVAAGQGAAGLCRLPVRRRRRGDRQPSEQPIEDLPETDANGKASFPVSLAKLPSTRRPLEAQISMRMAEAGGRAVERKLVLPVTPAAAMIGVKPLFGGRSLAEGDKAAFDVVFVAPDGKRWRARPALRAAEDRNPLSVVPAETAAGTTSRSRPPRASPTATIDIAADKPARMSLPVQSGRYRLDVIDRRPNGPVTSVAVRCRLVCRRQRRHARSARNRARQAANTQSGDTMTVSVNARTAGKLTLNVLGDRLLATQTTDVKEGTAQVKMPVGKDWGTGAYVVATLRRPLDAPAQRMPGRAIGLKWFAIDARPRRSASSCRRRRWCGRIDAEAAGQARRA